MKYYSIISDIHKIDNNTIRLACTIQLKVLLIMIKNSNKKYTSEKIASDLRKNINDIEEALEFWTNLNIIECSESEFEPVKKEKINKKVKIKKEYIFERIENSSEIKCLLNEAETILGRSLSCSDINVFMSLKDNEGLPCDVILMLIQYCVKIGKGSTRYIEKVGLDWAKSEIDSVVKAEEKIKDLDYSNSLWKKFENIIGVYRSPTAKEKEAVSRWFTEWKFDENIIKEAYDRCVDSKGAYKLSYMDAIVKKWKNNNISNINDIKKISTYGNKSRYKSNNYASVNIFE